MFKQVPDTAILMCKMAEKWPKYVPKRPKIVQDDPEMAKNWPFG
jgi:hypothetical protein